MIAKADNTEKNVNYLNGGFRGLYNSMDSHLIPDGYLAAMENLEVDEAGCIHSLAPPVAGASTLDRLVYYCGCPIWQDYTVSYSSDGTKVNNTSTISSVDGGWWASSADANVYQAGAGYDWTVYLCRFYYNSGNILRYSGIKKAHRSDAWNGANAYNFQAFPYVITHLQPLQSGLYVMGDGVISRMTEPKTGSTAEVYYGPRTPVGDGVSSYILNNGSSIVYCAADGAYMFGGQGDPQKIDMVIAKPAQALTQFYVAEYKNRVWVMRGNGEGLYAMNKTTGFWEYYNPTTMVAGQTFWKLGWPRTQMVNTLDLFSGTFNGATPWYNFGGISGGVTRMPWSFTTKDFTPSFDAYSRVVHVKFYYIGQAATSTATIQVYADGTLIDTVTQDMAGTGMLHKDYNCLGTLANSFHLVVSGTGKADIVDAGIEFTQRKKGDPNT